MRIIAGQYRGRRIPVPALTGLRPTPDRVRETLFNWLGQWLEGVSCLDLFAGSGALGFEAASRGAAAVVMVEHARAAYNALEKTRQMLGASQVELLFEDAHAYLERSTREFHVVFLDPPFGQNALPRLLERLPRVLAPHARVYIESPSPLEAKAPWSELRRARAGQVHYQLFQWRSDDQGGIPRNV